MNHLEHSTSPYLIQHRNNPVNWYPWGSEAWDKAKKEDKLVLVSIGYSACHWCHVMEHESFEDSETAELMNKFFICIKVDREERPDVDQVYMEAVQIIHGSGGWPLNCFTLPDGRPIHGGTYFRNADWKRVLIALKDLYANKKQEALDYATRLTQGVSQSKITPGKEIDFSAEKIDSIVLSWQNYFDLTEGGQDRAPKFPIPNNLEFLLHFGVVRRNKFILNFVHLTLHKIAWGGIYDQVGGGFARYSVDALWHVPHFEKMLYDNAQMLSLYSKAYQLSKNDFYKTIVDETITWITREMIHPEGGFYSALDADSEGVEGKFYTLSQEELRTVINSVEFETPGFVNHFELFYNITTEGNWHEEKINILNCSSNPIEYAKIYHLEEKAFETDIKKAKEILLEHRAQRIRPGLDDKILTSWNAMTIEGLCNAYSIDHNSNYIDLATTHYQFIKNNLWIDEVLYHTWHYSNRKPAIPGFLDDYAFLGKAAIALYQVTFDVKYLEDAMTLMKQAMEEFEDPDSGMLFYTSSKGEDLYTRKHEMYDNVIPSSNAIAATVLYILGRYFEVAEFTNKALLMLNTMQSKFAAYPSGYSQWMQLQMLDTLGLKTVCLSGKDSIELKMEFDMHHLPQVIYAGGQNPEPAVLHGKEPVGEKRIFICTDTSCLEPLATFMEAIKKLE